MNICKQTKLSVAVSNPSLPVFKTDIDDFTKAAIVASGNDTMSIDQKWALDEYFERIGALDAGSIWQKIKAIYMPAILNNREKIFVNYKDMNATPGYDGWQALDNGGAYTTYSTGTTNIVASTGIDINPTNISYYFSAADNFNDTFVKLMFDFRNGSNTKVIDVNAMISSTRWQMLVSDIANSSYAYRHDIGETTSVFGSELLATLNGRTNPDMNIYFRDMNNVDKAHGFYYYKNSAATPAADEDVTCSLRIVLDGTMRYNIIILGEAFTPTEAETVLQAGIDLKKAFINTNS